MSSTDQRDSVVQRAAVAVLTVAAAALCFSGSAIARWYNIEEPTVLAQNIGLFRSCSALGLSESRDCSSLSFSDITVVCGRDGSAMLARVRALCATSIIGPLLLLLSLCLGVGWSSASVAVWGSCVCGTAGVLLIAFTVAWSVYLFEGWYYCGTPYCQWRTTLGASGACSSNMGISWYLVIGGLACSLLALIILVIRLIVRLRLQSAPIAESSMKYSKPASSTTSLAKVSATISLPHAHAPEVHSHSRPPPPTTWPDFAAYELDDDNILPDGEWVRDDTCGLYWSNDEQLYVHLASGLFFDPHSQMWFDSDTNEWNPGT